MLDDVCDQGASSLLEAKDISEGTRCYLEEAIGVREIGSRDLMTVRAPSASEGASFRLPEDGRIAVFETRQTGVAVNGEPVRVTVTIYASDRNTFWLETGPWPNARDPRPIPKCELSIETDCRSFGPACIMAVTK